MEKILILGGARGLGGALRALWQKERPQDQLVVTSRKPLNIIGIESHICDFSQTQDVEKLLDFMQKWQPDRILCFPGGGPYGAFASKEWKDHHWALKVSLLTPLRVGHQFLKLKNSRQIVFVGSAIAEAAADPFAASYSIAKHGLLGFVESLQAENTGKDIRLFSPGYMATDMLPLPTRQKKQLPVKSAEETAEQMYRWVLDENVGWHFLPSLSPA